MDLVSLEFLSFFVGKVDEDMLQKIISLSPLVELFIAPDWGLGKISLPWSRKVNNGGECVGSGTMQYNLKTAPLKEFVYHGIGSTATWEWNMNMSALKNLRKLEIVWAPITDDIVSEMASGLTALESLELSSCSMLKSVKISSISLKEFRIKEVYNEIHLTKITIDTPNLLEFRCSCDVESYVLIRAQDRSNTCFLPPWVETITIVWFVKLKKFLTETNCFKSLVIDMGTFEKIDIDEDLLWSVGVTGSPYKLRELKLREKHDYFSFGSLNVEFLDALFLTCSPDVLSLSFQNMAPGYILGYLRRKVQCWKDPLKKVEVEGVDCSNLLSKPPEVEFRFRLSWFSVES
ncbi:uncharacterized protein LOC141590849 [Silene latifolia]|uniref:uncharacterized protein LOC141590849 n=1 Tax=Silene latifolia TaxID=37657 RepID=UPI003D783D51